MMDDGTSKDAGAQVCYFARMAESGTLENGLRLGYIKHAWQIVAVVVWRSKL